MARKYKRHTTDYPGVYFIYGTQSGTRKPEKIFYFYYHKDGKKVESKAGRQHKDKMTAAKANVMRIDCMTGKRKTNKEKREAEKARKAAKDSKYTIERLWESYTKNKPNIKGLTTDQNRFDLHIKPTFGKREPKSIMPLDVKRLENRLLKKKAPATVKNVLELLRRIINYGVKNRLCKGIDFTIEMPRVDNEKTEDLTPNQLSKLFEAIEKDKHAQAGPLMKLALFTGMRRGELFKLKWKHIDFERGFINLVDPKGIKDQVIPLNDAARQLLENHNKTKSPYIFPGRSGKMRQDINKAVNEIKKAAGLPKDFRPLHGLRHAYASALASSGEVDLYMLQKLLTHKSPELTMRYAHLRDAALKKAANVAAEIFQPTQKEDKSEVIPINSK